jgi:hypothetical protein
VPYSAAVFSIVSARDRPLWRQSIVRASCIHTSPSRRHPVVLQTRADVDTERDSANCAPVAITAYGADQCPLHGRAVGMKFLIQGLPEGGEHGKHPRLNVGNTNTRNDPDCSDDLTASLSAFGTSTLVVRKRDLHSKLHIGAPTDRPRDLHARSQPQRQSVRARVLAVTVDRAAADR